MHLLIYLLLSVSMALAQSHGEEESEDMGPVAFMWPPDRDWGAASDNTAPCGSVDETLDRTEFPMLNGQVALVMQDDAWNVEVSISHKNAPASNDDFEAIKAPIPDLDSGHMCYPIPNPPADVDAGNNATIQIKYTADFETDRNQTYYACADIYYVYTNQFSLQVPCFNVSSDDFEAPDDDNHEDGDSATTSTAPSAPASTADSSEADLSTSESSSSALSRGAIAGIVVGILALLAIIAALFFLWGRRKQRQKQREQEANVRAVQWKDDGRSSASGSKHDDRDIALNDMCCA